MALALTAVHLAIGLGVLAFGHPHEDAYILFKYARELAQGSGIVYFPGGPHAEGATDFLWMLLLAGARVVGIDVAVAAAILSSCGFFACAWTFMGALPKPRVDDDWPHVLFVVLLLLTPSAVAGYVGFSAMPFSAIALVLYRQHARGTDCAALSIPPLALLIALVRPDGVILGAGFAVLALRQISRAARVRYLASCALVTLAGAAYFVWRWRYFGHLLPLPLYVKSHYHDRPPGIDATLDWLASSVAPLILLGAAGRLFLGPLPGAPPASASAAPPETVPVRAPLLGLWPFAVHAATFALGSPSQNVANRFQAPATLALLYGSFVAGTARARARRATALQKVGYAATLLVVFVPHVTIARDVVLDSFWRHYMNVFGHRLAAVADRDTRIATTEAGRMAYWTDAEVLDLVGLNTFETAIRPPTFALLTDFAPDVIMMHHASTMDEGRLGDADATQIAPIDGALGSYVQPWARVFLRGDNPPYDVLHADNIVAAPVATAAFLDANRNLYELWSVPFKSRAFRFHVYAIKRTYPKKALLLEALRASEVSPRTSYLGLLRASPPR